jgi:hypothetical protein
MVGFFPRPEHDHARSVSREAARVHDGHPGGLSKMKKTISPYFWQRLFPPTLRRRLSNFNAEQRRVCKLHAAGRDNHDCYRLAHRRMEIAAADVCRALLKLRPTQDRRPRLTFAVLEDIHRHLQREGGL